VRHENSELPGTAARKRVDGRCAFNDGACCRGHSRSGGSGRISTASARSSELVRYAVAMHNLRKNWKRGAMLRLCDTETAERSCARRGRANNAELSDSRPL